MSKLSALLAALVLACATPSCAWDSEWLFGATKACYGGSSSHGGGGGGSEVSGYGSRTLYSGGKSEAGTLAFLFFGLILVPIAIDVVCLPFECVHDLFFLD